MQKYNPKEIEPKWQQIWQETSIYTADLDSAKPKYIGMSQFNYPSGLGIHIGHAMTFTISDVKARFKRQQGFESYHPVGWDSFGLPAENYAIKAGISPQQSMAEIIPNYHKQYQAMGWSNDWEKEIATHQPEYYKWTQWIFSQMHRNGLAYQDARQQWWCNQCQTVLANEQIVDGKCWRHDSPDDPIIEKREVKQWFFKITDYADELLAATDDLDWTESVKLAQKNWIGRSEGAEITFAIEGHDQTVTVFTVAHDTIYGTTFMVIAPEHKLVEQITTDEQKATVDSYVKEASFKSELERMSDKTKTGVFTGAYAVNPVNGAKVPIWIADYVLAGYGTGAVMGVPGEDGRDFEFAGKYGLEVIYTNNTGAFIEYHETIKKDPKKYTLINSGEFNGIDFAAARQKILDKLIALGVGKAVVNYKMRDWSVSRQRYWGAPIPIVYCKNHGAVLVPDAELPVVLPELTDFKPSGDGRSALARAKDWLKTTCPECGGEAERETDTLDTYICSSWYMLRYTDPHNQEAAFSSERANNWMPINFYNGGDHATAHMLYARFVTRFFHKLGLVNDPEPFKQFLFNGKVVANDGAVFSKSKGNGPDPLEIINSGYGADALRTYLMFAAPLDQTAIRWNPEGVPGAYRYLGRLWNLVQEYLSLSDGDLSEVDAKKLLIVTNKSTKKVTEDIEANLYNTAIAASMAMLNDLTKLKTAIPFVKNDVWQQALEAALMLIAPFAPHITEELWQQLGHSDSIHKNHWPEVDETYLQEDEITIVLQVNGKVRAEIKFNKDASKEELERAALANPRVQEFLNSQEPKKVIVVPGKLVNVVV